MRPALEEGGSILLAGNVAIPWDAANNRPMDYEGEAGRIWEALKAEHGISAPDPYEAPPVPVPQTISDRQFFQALAMMGLIDPAEALAAVKTGEIPAALEAFIDQLPTDEKFAAEMVVSGATIFERSNPMTLALAAGMGWSSEQIDDLWRAAAQL